jgi:hypothetical protein
MFMSSLMMPELVKRDHEDKIRKADRVRLFSVAAKASGMPAVIRNLLSLWA